MDPIVIILAGALLWQNVKLPAFLVKHPPTAELVAAQAGEKAAKEREAVAVAALEAAKADERDKKDAQVAYAQEMAHGTGLALERVRPDQMTPEIQLATSLNARAQAGLDAARGQLSPEARKELDTLVANALSAVTAQRDSALAALAVKDAEFITVSKAREIVAAQIPVLEAKAVTATNQLLVAEASHDALEAKVIVYAQQKHEAEVKAGSLDATIGRIIWSVGGGLLLLAFLYYVAHFGLPSLTQEFPDNKLLSRVDKAVRSISSSHI